MSAARPPGWYDEPSGEASRLRWWDGESWTAVTRQRSPSELVPEQSPAAARPTGLADLLDSGGPRRPESRRGLVLAGVAVAVVALLLLTVLPGRGGDGDRLADPGPVSTAPGPGPTAEPRPAPTTPRPVSGRIVDRVARLSYDVLPGDWRQWDRDTFRGLVSTAGYYRITQDSVPNGQTYWANVSSGRIDADVAPGDLRTAGTALVDTLARGYYPGHRRDGLTQRAVTVDGARAHLIRYRAVFYPQSAGGYLAKSEEIAVLMVDTGDEVPSVLYVSLPDTVSSLWPAVDDLIASVRILR